jgi:hypothetical protein
MGAGSLWLDLATFYLSLRKISISYQNLFIFLAKPQPYWQNLSISWKKIRSFLNKTFMYFWPNLYILAKPLIFLGKTIIYILTKPLSLLDYIFIF